MAARFFAAAFLPAALRGAAFFALGRLLAGRFAAAERLGQPLAPPPPTTALGALIGHITGGHLAGSKFQPMNINYGLLPPLDPPKVDEDGKKIPLKERGRAKKRLMSLRAMVSLKAWRDAG